MKRKSRFLAIVGVIGFVFLYAPIVNGQLK